jgi:hypothetical protein
VYEKYDGGMVYLGDGSPLSIVGCGRVLIKFPDGRVKRMIGVFHILGLEQNIISVHILNYVGV